MSKKNEDLTTRKSTQDDDKKVERNMLAAANNRNSKSVLAKAVANANPFLFCRIFATNP